MKLLNYYPHAQAPAHLGVVMDGKVLDVTAAFPDDSRFVSVSSLLRANALRDLQQKLNEHLIRRQSGTSLETARYAPPLDDRCRIFCVGLNYADHAAENNLPRPESPIFFAKLAAVAIGSGEPIPLPANSSQVDYEAEIAFVIGERASRIRGGSRTTLYRRFHHHE